MSGYVAAAALPMPKVKKIKRRDAKALRAMQEEYRLYAEDFKAVQRDLTAALSSFEHISDHKGVDVCIYQIQYAQSRCDNILRKMKNLSLQIRSFGLN